MRAQFATGWLDCVLPVNLQPQVLVYKLGTFLRTLATPEPIKDWSNTTLRKNLLKIGAKVFCQPHHFAFQMPEIGMPRNLLVDILRILAELRPPTATSTT